MAENQYEATLDVRHELTRTGNDLVVAVLASHHDGREVAWTSHQLSVLEARRFAQAVAEMADRVDRARDALSIPSD